MTYETAIALMCGLFIGVGIGIALMSIERRERGTRRTDGEILEQAVHTGPSGRIPRKMRVVGTQPDDNDREDRERRRHDLCGRCVRPRETDGS